MPTWSPDGKRIIFASDRAGSFDLYEKSVGQAPERELLKSNLWKYPESWSPDGRTLLFSQLDPKTRSDIWLLPLEGGKPTLFVGTDADEMHGRFSPDGHWVAYTSTESGRQEVYVRAFPLSDPRWQVSVAGGANPLWRRDGRELFYLTLDNRVMSAVVNARGTTFEAGVPSTLFNAGPVVRGAAALAGDRLYAVTSRGDRFLVLQLASDVRESAITLVVGRR
jgi:Tol biopolymer transport system component